MMTAQVQQQTQQMQANMSGDYAERLVRVEKDVAGLTAGLAALTGSVERGFAALTSDLKARSTLNWQPISLLAMILIAFAGWGWALFGSYQSRTDAAITEQKMLSSRFVDRQDISDKFQVAKEKNDLRQTTTDARIQRIEADIDALTKQVVPRGEHNTLGDLQRMKDEGFQRQIDGLRKDLGDLNTPRDTIQGMQRRIDELERDARTPARR